jgi:hypothetical protein
MYCQQSYKNIFFSTVSSTFYGLQVVQVLYGTVLLGRVANVPGTRNVLYFDVSK